MRTPSILLFFFRLSWISLELVLVCVDNLRKRFGINNNRENFLKDTIITGRKALRTSLRVSFSGNGKRLKTRNKNCVGPRSVRWLELHTVQSHMTARVFVNYRLTLFPLLPTLAYNTEVVSSRLWRARENIYFLTLYVQLERELTRFATPSSKKKRWHVETTREKMRTREVHKDHPRKNFALARDSLL